VHASREQRATEVLRQFRLVYGSVRRHLRQVQQACGVSGSLVWMLRELEKSPGIGVSELAERLSLHTSTASQLAEKLVKGAYVTKTRSMKDQRRVGLRLTRKGAETIRRAPQPTEGVLPQALVALSDRTLRSLHANLAQVLRRIASSDIEDASRPIGDL
jgi:DNA-binding MarR family transcriptional regulator